MRTKRPADPGDEDRIIKFLSAHRSHSYSARDLAKKLKLKRRDFKAFRRVMRRLAKQNVLMELGQGVYQWPSQQKAPRTGKKGSSQRPGREERRAARQQRDDALRVEGTLQQYKGGFAFLIPKNKDME